MNLKLRSHSSLPSQFRGTSGITITGGGSRPGLAPACPMVGPTVSSSRSPENRGPQAAPRSLSRQADRQLGQGGAWPESVAASSPGPGSHTRYSPCRWASAVRSARCTLRPRTGRWPPSGRTCRPRCSIARSTPSVGHAEPPECFPRIAHNRPGCGIRVPASRLGTWSQFIGTDQPRRHHDHQFALGLLVRDRAERRRPGTAGRREPGPWTPTPGRCSGSTRRSRRSGPTRA